MIFPRVERISLPAGSLAEHAFARIDYTDTYRVQLPSHAPHDVDVLYQTVFSLPSTSWIARLMALRNTLVSFVGLKTVEPQKIPLPQRPLQAGDRTLFLNVIQRSSNELLLGEDDRHLNFRVSVLRQHNDTSEWLVVSSVVQFNHWFGRLYFLPVQPIHQRLVPWMLKNAARRLEAQSAHKAPAPQVMPLL